MIAIDPGKSGGFAWRDEDGNPQCCSMPDTEGDVLDLICKLRVERHVVAVVEEVGGYCGKASPGSAMFNFGRGFGFMLGALMALGFSVVMVRPQKWQKHFSLGKASQCASSTEWKNKLKSEAQRRFPTCKVTLATADALLIMAAQEESKQ